MSARQSQRRGPIRVHIEELVLEGIPQSDRHRIGESLERELGRLLAGEVLPGVLRRGGAVPRIDAGSFEVAPGSKPDAVGAQIARAVYRGMKRPARSHP